MRRDGLSRHAARSSDEGILEADNLGRHTLSDKDKATLDFSRSLSLWKAVVDTDLPGLYRRAADVCVPLLL